MSAHTLALSILSMLSSAKEKKIPQDNHVRKSLFSLSLSLISHLLYLRMPSSRDLPYTLAICLCVPYSPYHNTQIDADNPPGRAQENWLYHDDRC